MTQKFRSSIDLNQNQIFNPVIHKSETHPENPVDGQIYYNIIEKAFFYYSDELGWIEISKALPLVDDPNNGLTITRGLNSETIHLKVNVDEKSIVIKDDKLTIADGGVTKEKLHNVFDEALFPCNLQYKTFKTVFVDVKGRVIGGVEGECENSGGGSTFDGYTKSEMNDLLEKKADKIYTYTKVEVDNKFKEYDDLISNLQGEIDLIKNKLEECCNAKPPVLIPSITNFKIKYNSRPRYIRKVGMKGNTTSIIEGNSLIQFTDFTFDIENISEVVPNSLNLIGIFKEINRSSGTFEEILLRDLSINSPITDLESLIDEFSISVNEEFGFYATILGKDGNKYKSNTFTLTCVKPETPEPPKDNIMFYGNTSTSPQEFQAMSIDEIFNLGTNIEKEIVGDKDVTFTINQLERVHYLLIPEEHMELVRAEYGEQLITVLWDGKQGAYVTRNAGGTYNGVKYKVFFSYSPQGAFSEDIRITCKNK